jgi:RNA polymerase sigma-70 factor, ECF subfamily
VSEFAWIDAAIVGARPQAVAALLRYFRDLDLAEEAFQEASLRALRQWPDKGPPRDPTAWLIFVGRNAQLDNKRKTARNVALPEDDIFPDSDDAEADMAERLDGSDYRDDILRLLFVCCHSELPAVQQIALALRIVSGLSVTQIARAFLVSDSAMEQRITRAKARIAKSPVPFEAPGAIERSERLAAVMAMIYLLFNEGYSASEQPLPERTQLCDEAIRLTRLLLRLFPAEPEMMGLLALQLLQHARLPARYDPAGSVVVLEEQNRTLWNAGMIAEGLSLIDKAMRHKAPGPYQVQAAIAALHARATLASDTDWAGIDQLYEALERMQPSPVVTLNRAVAISKARGPEHALAMIEPLAEPLAGYFNFHGLKGALLMQLDRPLEARLSLDKAISLARSPVEANHIRQKLDALLGVT